MPSLLGRRNSLLPALGAVLLLSALPGLASAEQRPPGSFFLLEANTGLSSAAYPEGSVGIAYGLTAGLTFKPKALPLRIYLLTAFGGRHLQSSGDAAGIPYATETADYDWYGSVRLGIPVLGGLRFYVDGGLGHRWTSSSLTRGSGLEPLAFSDGALLFVGGLGLSYRLSPNLSVGLRGELTATAQETDPIASVTHRLPEQQLGAIFAQVGLHF